MSSHDAHADGRFGLGRRVAGGAVVALGIAVLTVWAASSAAAQTPPAGLFGDVERVEVVNVDVHVTDRDGRPVEDLEREDFRLRVDGEEVEVEYFSRVTGSEAAGERPLDAGFGTAADWIESTGGGAGTGPVHLAVYIDAIHAGPASRARVFEDLWRVLERRLGPDDEVMIAVYNGSLTVPVPFTTERERVREALERFGELTALQVDGAVENDRMLETMQTFQRFRAEGSGLGSDVCVETGEVARYFAERTRGRVLQSIDALDAFVSSMAGIPGRKAVLHLSDGIPLVPGGQVYQYALDLCSGRGQQQGLEHAYDAEMINKSRFDPTKARLDMLSYDTSDAWQELTANANAHHVSLYPVQVGGLRGSTVPATVRTTQQTAQFRRRNLQDSLVLAAEETGGEAILNTNEIGGEVDEMIRDSRSYYLLGFTPAQGDAGDTRQIRVDVDRPGVRVRHRKSYRTKGVHEQVADGVLTTLLYERTSNPLEAGLTFERPDESADDSTRVNARLAIPLERLTLMAQDGTSAEGRRGLLTVFVALRGESGGVRGVRTSTVPVDIGAEPPESFTYDIGLALEPGTHEVAVAVRDDLGGTTSYLRDSVAVERR